MKKELKLEVGKSYRNRKGVVVKITAKDPTATIFPFLGNYGAWYQINGEFLRTCECSEDLMVIVPLRRLSLIRKIIRRIRCRNY